MATMSKFGFLLFMHSLVVLLHAETQKPIARHQLIPVETGSTTLIQFKSHVEEQGKEGTFSICNVDYKIISMNTSGTLYHLSSNFIKYSYHPIEGSKILSGVETTVAKNANGKVYYKRIVPDQEVSSIHGTIEYVAIDVFGKISNPGTITLVSSSGVLASSQFLYGNDEWKISGNIKSEPYAATHNPIQLARLNYFISGSDTIINVDENGKNERSLWYFNAPLKYYGNMGIAYMGSVSFTIGSSVGNFSPDNFNPDDTKAIILTCDDCDGPVHKGITLAISVGLLRQLYPGIGQEAKDITISLAESAGWEKDSQNVNKPWTKASQCDMIQVLSRLTSFKILGDWTLSQETVHIDNVMFKNTKGQLPLCAQSVPDASVCTCT